MNTIKRFDNYKILVLLPIFSALLLGLSRLPINLDMLVFVAFIPILYYFEINSSNKVVNQDDNFHKRFLWKSSLMHFKNGVVFSTIFLLVSIHWISIVTFPGFLGILLLFGFIFGVLFWIVGLFYMIKPKCYRLSFILVWLSFEYLTNYTEFKFPWFNIAYGLKNSINLIQIAEIGGVTLIGLLILVINYLFYLSITKNKKYYMISFLILLFWYFGGMYRLQHLEIIETDFKIAVLQGNIDQDLKWHSSMIDSTFNIYESLGKKALKEENVDLIIFPEAALPVYLLQRKQYYNRLLDIVDNFNKPVFTGFPYYKQEYLHKGQIEPYLYYNAANLFTPEYSEEKVYFKNILVPFGERMPFLDDFPLLWKLQFGQANFEKGTEFGLYKIGGYSFSPLICFEIVFPQFLRKISYDFNPHFWVNLTNDAWFKKSIGTHQHASMAVFRSIETRKAVFRSANTGYSFYTTPDGTIHKMTNLYDRTYLTGKLSIYNVITPYVKYGYLLPIIIFIFFALQIFKLLLVLFYKKLMW
jgi:apolipoprotein N-acyltransferase